MHALRGILLAALAASILPARADEYPAKPVRLVATVAAGGNVDLMARLVAQKLTEGLGRSFVVDNRGGAAGVIAEEIVARAAPDGYTLLFTSLTHVTNSAMNKKLAYDPVRDFVPVSLVVSVPNVLVVSKSVNVQSVPELIKLARAKPGELSYAASYGTTLQLAGELFKTMTGTDIVIIQYKSGGLAVPDIEAGRVQMAFSVMTTAMTMLKNGRVRALAVTSSKRSPALPNVPAIAEFVPGYEITGWQGVMAPTGTPKPIISKLSTELARGMHGTDVQARLSAIGADPIGSTPEEFGTFLKAEFARMSTLIAKAGIKPEM